MPIVEGRTHNGRLTFSCPGCRADMSRPHAPGTGKTWMDCDSCGMRYDVTVPGYQQPSRTLMDRLVVTPLPADAVLASDVGALPRLQVTGGTIVAGVIFAWIMFAIFGGEGALAFMLSVFSGGVLVLLVSRSQYQSAMTEHARKLANEQRRREHAREEEAAKLTANLRHDLRDIPQAARLIATRYNGVIETLSFAQREFASRACSSFWDAIGHAKDELLLCSSDIQTLTKRVKTYGERLRRRQHTFPLAPLPTDALPPMDDAFRELSALARHGEIDFQFATILEHKKTRGVLVEGFSSVAGAIDGLAISFERNLELLASELAPTIGFRSRPLPITKRFSNK